MFFTVSCILLLQQGEKFSSRTDQLLSSSFALTTNSTSVKKVTICGCGLWVWLTVLYTQTLLAAVNMVCGAYKAGYHTSRDTKFRALVCEGFK